MKKYLCFALATLMLLTALVGCNVKPTPPNGDGTQTEQPGTNPGTNPGTTNPGTTNPGTTNPGTTDPGTTDPGTTDPGTDIPHPPTLKDDEIEKTTEHVVGNGKFVFYEHKYDYAGGQIVLMDMKNETDSNYDVKIHATYYDENGAEILSETRTIPAVAAGYQTPVLLWPQTAFATYSYTLETTPYDGVCWGEKYSIEYTGLAVSVTGTMLKATGKYSNYNTEAFWSNMTFVLFNNKGELYGLYMHGMESRNGQCKDNELSMMFVPYTSKEKPFVWPEELTGDLRCVVIPYFGENPYELFYNSDALKFDPECPPPNPELWK